MAVKCQCHVWSGYIVCVRVYVHGFDGSLDISNDSNPRLNRIHFQPGEKLLISMQRMSIRQIH